MIFKTAVKYKFLQYCLEIICDKIQKNFDKKKYVRRLPCIGDRYKQVDVFDGSSTDSYCDCTVSELYVRINGDYETVSYITDNSSDVLIAFDYEYDANYVYEEGDEFTGTDDGSITSSLDSMTFHDF